MEDWWSSYTIVKIKQKALLQEASRKRGSARAHGGRLVTGKQNEH